MKHVVEFLPHHSIQFQEILYLTYMNGDASRIPDITGVSIHYLPCGQLVSTFFIEESFVNFWGAYVRDDWRQSSKICF